MDRHFRFTPLQNDHSSEIDSLSIISSTDNGNEALDRTTGSDYDPGVQATSVSLGRPNNLLQTDLSQLTFQYHPNSEIDRQLHALASRYEIQPTQIKRLCKLENYKIVILCDDSGSMLETVDGTNHTRWDELLAIVKIAITIGCIFDPNGVDICFLNRQDTHTIRNPSDVDGLFVTGPRGYTPLARALRKILQLPAARHDSEKKLLVFIATDGAPTDEYGTPNVSGFEHVMRYERKSETTHVTFLLCTDEPECVNYLVNFDQTMVNVDVTDDFKTEKEKIRRHQGAGYPFSKGDYIVKALVGAIDREIDLLNERNYRSIAMVNNRVRQNDCCQYQFFTAAYSHSFLHDIQEYMAHYVHRIIYPDQFVRKIFDGLVSDP